MSPPDSHLLSELVRHRREMSALRDRLIDATPHEADALGPDAAWSNTFDALPDMIAIIDAQHRIRRVNRAMADRLASVGRPLVGLRCHDVIHGCDVPPEDCPHARTLRDGLARSASVFEETLGGDILVTTAPILDDAGEVVATVHVARTLQSLPRDVEALRAGRAAFDGLLRALPVGVTILDGAGGIVTTNPALADILGLSPDAPAVLEPGIRALRERRETASEELGVQRSDGSLAWLQVTARPLDPPDEGVVIVYTDVTERRRAEVEREKLAAQLMQAQKMESIGRLAGGIAHDFNNLLTGILGYSEIALSALSPDDPAHACLTEIRRAGERAAQLTAQLLGFARKQVIHPRPLDLNATVRDAEALLSRLAGEDIVLETLLAPDLWPVSADAGQLQQLLVNMVVNARDAMPTGGRLVLRTRNERIASAGDGIPSGQWVVLEIRDHGVGMSEDVRARLFEPFFTTKPPGKGTGLGLAMCHGIVTQNGGHIGVESAPGTGTTFTIRFPRAAGRPVAQTTRRAGHTPGRGHETILLAEDEPTVRSLVASALATRGYTVLAAADGPEALALARRTDGPLDLLVTDVVMPGWSGPELASEVHALRPGLRVLFISGHAERFEERPLPQRFGTRFLSKPFTPDRLAQAVRELLDTDTPARG